MAKTQLNKARREILLSHIEDTVLPRIIDRTRENELYDALIDGANKAIRAKYPEADMAVLRKYKCVRVDRCLRFQFPTGRVDGFNFPYKDESRIADVPSSGGCFRNDVFAVDDAIAAARATLKAYKPDLYRRFIAEVGDEDAANATTPTEEVTMQKGKRYVGERTPDGVQVVVIQPNGEAYPLNPRFDLRMHSPDGFNFGYGGSGPSQLALALLADALGDDDRAQANYQAVKFRVIGRLSGDRFELTEQQLRQVVDEIETYPIHRYGLYWSGYEPDYKPRTAASLAAARERREARVVEREATNAPLFAEVIREQGYVKKGRRR